MSYEAISNDSNNSVESSYLASEGLLASWKSMLSRRVDGAVSLGVMTAGEAGLWYEGIENCQQIDHVIELSPYFDQFFDSGIRAIDDVELSVRNESLLTSQEKIELVERAKVSEYQEKLNIPNEVFKELQSLRREQKRLEVLFQQLDARIAKVLEKDFYASSADKKLEVVATAEIELAKRVAEVRALQESKLTSELVDKIERELSDNQLDSAEILVNRLGVATGYGKIFQAWLQQVNELRIQKIKADFNLYEQAA